MSTFLTHCVVATGEVYSNVRDGLIGAVCYRMANDGQPVWAAVWFVAGAWAMLGAHVFAGCMSWLAARIPGNRRQKR